MTSAGTVRGLLLACVLVLSALPSCSGSSQSAGPAPSGGSSSPESARYLLYLRGPRLHRLNLDSGGDEVIRTLPVAEVQASSASSWLALVGASGDGDFAAHPRLGLLDADSGHRRRLGPGFAPLWRPDGKALAYLRPVEQRRCEAESCLGRVEVMIASVSGATQTVAGPGHWTILSWAGSRLLLGDIGRRNTVTIAGPDGPPQHLPLSPAELWGASPDGRWVIQSRRRGAVYVALSPTGELGRRRELVPAGRLAEGAWSPDSNSVAGVLLHEGSGAVPRTRVVLSSPESSGRRLLPGSVGAAGAPMWSPDGRTIAFPQAAGPAGGRLRAQVCVLEETTCESWLNWTDEVRLLRLE